MVVSTKKIKSIIKLSDAYYWEDQLIDLKATFKEFELLSFKVDNNKYSSSHVFEFTHQIELDVTLSFDKRK